MSSKRISALLVTLLAACVVAPHVQAAPASLTGGARPMGMGGAFTAVADDADAAFYNPAGVAGLEQTVVALTRTALFSGPTDPLVSQDSAHLAVPIGNGAVTAGATMLGDRDGIYRQTTVVAGYATPLGKALRAGLLAKWFGVGLGDVLDVTQNPYFADGTSASAVSLDVGLLVAPVEGWTLGLAAQNLLPADLALNSTAAPDGDDAPLILRLGSAYRLAGIAPSAQQAAFGKVLERSLMVVDVAVGDGTLIGAGLEVGLSDTLTGRVGYRVASGLGESASAITLGGSLAFDVSGLLIHADYGIDLANTQLKDNISQRISLRASL